MEFLWCIPVLPVSVSMSYYFYQRGQTVSIDRERCMRNNAILDKHLLDKSNYIGDFLKACRDILNPSPSPSPSPSPNPNPNPRPNPNPNPSRQIKLQGISN